MAEPEQKSAPEQGGSLAGQAASAGFAGLRALGKRLSARKSPAEARNWPVAAGIALLLAAGPAATILGANLLAENARREAAKLSAQAAPRVAVARAATAARAELLGMLRRPTLGATLETLARVLPADAMLVRVEQRADLLEIEVATPDPDSLRGALRRAPELARLREVDQRRGDAQMLVTLRGTGA